MANIVDWSGCSLIKITKNTQWNGSLWSALFAHAILSEALVYEI